MSVKQELIDLQKKHGELTPDLVWRTARENPKMKLHKQFEWNISKAAQAHWLERAREIIRSFKITIKVERRQVTVSYFVRDPDSKPDEQGYRSILDIRQDPVASRKLMEEEFKHAEEHLARAKAIALVVRHPLQ